MRSRRTRPRRGSASRPRPRAPRRRCSADQPGRLDEILRRHDAAGRVLRRVEDDELRSRRQPLGEIGDREGEVALLEQRQRNRRRADPADRRLVDREARIGIDHLVAGLADGQDREEEERLGARSRRARSPDRTVTPRVRVRCSRDRLPELDDAGARAVVRLTGAHRLVRRLARRAAGCRSRARRSRGAPRPCPRARAPGPARAPRTPSPCRAARGYRRGPVWSSRSRPRQHTAAPTIHRDGARRPGGHARRLLPDARRPWRRLVERVRPPLPRAVLARLRGAGLRGALERAHGSRRRGRATGCDLRLSERPHRLLAPARDAALHRASGRPRGRAGLPAAGSRPASRPCASAA